MTQTDRDLGKARFLTRATVCGQQMRWAGARLVVLGSNCAVVPPVDLLDLAEAGRSGRERDALVGGLGPPKVTALAGAELGARVESMS